MRKILAMAGVFVLGASIAAAQDVMTAIRGIVKRVDSVSKTIVVTAEDGTVHTFHYLGRTTVHGAQDVAAGTKDAAKDSFKGVKEGSDVVVHYTKKGTVETAQEVDKVGKDGMKETEGTVTKIDRDAKTMVVKTEDGTEQTFRMTDHAAKDAGKDVASGAEKGGKVTVYYTEEAGHKVAHFFKKVV